MISLTSCSSMRKFLRPEKLLEPDLILPRPTAQDEQYPEFLRVVALVLAVLGVEGFYWRVVEDPTAWGRRDCVEKHLAQFALEPFADRNLEALLREREQMARQDMFERLAKRMFFAQPVDLQFPRNAEGRLDDAIIEKRRAHFKPDLHAHHVNFGEDVIGQLDLRVHIEHRVDEVAVKPRLFVVAAIETLGQIEREHTERRIVDALGGHVVELVREPEEALRRDAVERVHEALRASYVAHQGRGV